MSVYQSNPKAAPDSEFEPGRLEHLVVGNTGRLLDPRRTPVTIVDIRPATGEFTVRLDDFEDAGARWLVPFEKVEHYQFRRGQARAAKADVEGFQRAAERFSRPLVIEPDLEARPRTEERIQTLQAEADTWLAAHSRFLADGRELPDPAGRRGDPVLAADLRSYMESRDLWDLEDAFARRYVLNPGSGDLVKGHQVVLAELGLVPFRGTVVRDPATFEGKWSKDRRAAHLCARLAFLRAFFARLERPHVILWRGLSTETPLEPDRWRSLVSASFDDAVARSHFEAGTETSIRLLIRQAVPITRLLMTYLETGAMNENYLEAEAVLLADPDNAAF